MSTPQQTPDEFAQEMIEFAGRRLAEGIAPAEVEKELVGQGVEPGAAHMVVDGLVQAGGETRRVAARKNILYGALWCFGGLLFTLFSLQAAQDSGGGKFIVATGAIGIGALQMIRGLFQVSD